MIDVHVAVKKYLGKVHRPSHLNVLQSKMVMSIFVFFELPEHGNVNKAV